MEILQFGLNGNLGGIEIYLKTLWSHMDHTRFHFSFIVSKSNVPPCFYEEFKAGGCDFYSITPRRVSVRQNRKEVFELFNTHRFDLLHFNSNTLSYILPIEAAVKNGCKVIVHGHNAETARTIPRLLHGVNKRRLRKLDVNRVAVSSAAGKWFFGNDAYSVFLNGIETEKFRFTEKNREESRQEANCTDRLVIGHVGTFMPSKNHAFIIEIFENVIKRNPNAVLWLIGDGNSDGIRRLVNEKGLSDKVVFWGRRTDLPRLYAGMDVFLFPSLFEGFGLVLLEAGCEGVPCLVSDCVPDEARNSANNIFSCSLNESADVWAKKLLKAAACQKKDRTACHSEIAKAGFSIEQEVSKMEKLYKSLA